MYNEPTGKEIVVVVVGEMCESSGLAALATRILDWLQDENGPCSVQPRDQLILKVEVRFLMTFLKYTAGRFTGILSPLGRRINKVYEFLASPTEGPTSGLLVTVASAVDAFPTKVDDGVRDVLDKIKLVKQEITYVLMKVSMLSATSVSRLSDELVLEFINSLLEDLEELHGCMAADSIQSSLKEGVKVLKTKLTSLKRLLSFVAKRRNRLHKLNQLFIRAQATADHAASLAWSCLIHRMDEDMASGSTVWVSDLLRMIDHVVREIYVGVLEAPKSSESKYPTLAGFVDSLLESTSELLNRDIMPMRDQIEILMKGFAFLHYFIRNAGRLTKHGNSNDLLQKVEVITIDAGCVIYSLLEDELNQETRLALSKLLGHFKLVSEIYVGSSVKARVSNLPTIDVLGTLGLLLRDLKELLNVSDDSINLLKDHIQIVHTDMGFLESFLTTIKKRRHEHEKLEDLWRRIINVIYEVEYVIDLVVIKDGPVLHHKFWLSYLIEEIELVKIEISGIQFSEMNICDLQGHNVRKRSSSLVLGTPRIDEEMVGFKDEERKLIEQLVGEPKQLQIVSIVGMAGLGKTFLAQKIYNNPIIKKRFDIHAWSSVSQVYQRKHLLINILSQLKKFTEEKSEMTDEELAAELHRCLKGQRYLIVLDDVWDIEAWKALRRSFPNDNNGSRIVFTSRFSELASQAKSDSKIHRLRSFSDSESWELLKKKIFQTESCPSELLEVGQHIAKRCNGLPLAVVVVAGLLGRTVEELDRWRDIANRLSSFIITDPQRQCMDILDLSYKSLPDYLKPCFLYLGTFPEDKEIPVKKLIWLWIAEGFVQDKEPNLEDVAWGYLMDLIGKTLVIASKERSTNGPKTCILHDLVREFCLAKAKEENFLMLIEGSDELPIWTPSKSNVPTSPSTSYEQRRIGVHLREGKLNWCESFGPYVRSFLFTVPGHMHFPANEFVSIIQRLRLLRVLDLVNVVLNTFPEGIGSLVLLRYLAVCAPCAVVPPQSIASLRNLETLIISGDLGSCLGDIILNLTELRHLHIDSLRALRVSGFDESFQCDTLQTLSGLSLSYGDYMEIKRRFPNLKKLSCGLRGSLDPSGKCIWLLPLDFLTQLESLKIHARSKSLSQQMLHTDGFSLSSNIRKLTMSEFRLPWEQISIIAKLPNLEVLKLLSDAFEGEEWNTQEGEFQKLKVLKLSYLDIRRWIASSDCFSLLERLILDNCYLLEEIPSCLEDIDTLKVVQVFDCQRSLESLVERIQEAQIDFGNEQLKIEIKGWIDYIVSE